MAASPIHFHDHLFLRGKYGLKKKLPAVPGTEGSGTVIATGGGLVARALQGRRVACAAKPDGDGPWADYMVTSANLCLPLRSQITFEEGATILGNPLTAWAFIEIAKRGGHRAIVQSAAAGTLGRMVLKLATRFGIPVINIIRSAEQAQLLKSAGASYILDSSADGFPERLKELSRQLHATLAFDPVSGESTGRFLDAMPNGSRIIVYGALSDRPCQIKWESLCFEAKHVEGFWLLRWMSDATLAKRVMALGRIQMLVTSDFTTDIRGRFTFDQAAEALDASLTQMGGKMLFVPSHQASEWSTRTAPVIPAESRSTK